MILLWRFNFKKRKKTANAKPSSSDAVSKSCPNNTSLARTKAALPPSLPVAVEAEPELHPLRGRA